MNYFLNIYSFQIKNALVV